jgi:hypothetical protein
MELAGKAHRARIFPAYGVTQSDGHGGFCSRGVDAWGGDVLAFLASSLRR